jgi:hypothetical protein
MTMVDTPYERSWADEEFRRANNKPVHSPLPDWWGKPAILIPNLITIGPIDAKWARVFNG